MAENRKYVAFVASCYNEVDAIKKELKQAGRDDIGVYPYKTEPDGYEFVEYHVRPNKFYAQILDLAQVVSTHGFDDEVYIPPERSGDRQHDKETISKIKEELGMEHLKLVLEDGKLESITRENYEIKLTELKRTDKRLTQMTVKELQNRIEVEDDVQVIVAALAVLADRLICEDMTNKWGKPVRGYVSDKDKDVIDFMNPNSIAWISETWIEAFEDLTPFYMRKYRNALRTRGRNVIKLKKSIYSLRFFIEWLIENDMAEQAMIGDTEAAGQATVTKNGIEFEGISEDEIPFGLLMPLVLMPFLEQIVNIV